MTACKCSSDRPWSCHSAVEKFEDNHTGNVQRELKPFRRNAYTHHTHGVSLQLNLAAAYTGCRMSPSRERPQNFLPCVAKLFSPFTAYCTFRSTSYRPLNLTFLENREC